MKKSIQILSVLAALTVAIPAQAFLFDDDDGDITAVCVTKKGVLEKKLHLECATGDDDACEARKELRSYSAGKLNEEQCEYIDDLYKSYVKKQ